MTDPGRSTPATKRTGTINERLLRDVHSLTGNAVLDRVMVFAAKDLVFVVFLALVAFAVPALLRRDWLRLFAVGGSLVLAFALGLVAAALYTEPRPFTTHPDLVPLVRHAAGQSFPSDHATAAFAVALAVLFFLSRAGGLVLLVVAALIAFARVYDGVHYPGDVLGSLLVALVGVGAVALLFSYMERRPSGRGQAVGGASPSAEARLASRS